MPNANTLSTGFSTQLLDAHAALENVLKAQGGATGVRTVSLSDGAGGIANVEGVAIGLGDEGDAVPGGYSLNVFVTPGTSKDKVRELVVDGLGVQAAGDLPLTVRESGAFEAQMFNFRMRPAPEAFPWAT